jgi:sortase A
MKRIYWSHRRFNDGLTVVVIAFGIYLIAAPFWPRIQWWLHPPTPIAAQQVVAKTESTSAGAQIPDENLLIIPRLGMKEEIHDGSSIAELRKGAWLLPATSQPDQKSNTVIIGHRFTYAGPAVFYFLDKVQTGDSIVIDWHGSEYTYEVSSIKEVPPTQTSVEAATSDAQLTLYTCTPLWTASHRLVIVAPLKGVRT